MNFPYPGKLDAKPMKERCRTDSQKTQGMSEKSIHKFEGQEIKDEDRVVA